LAAEGLPDACTSATGPNRTRGLKALRAIEAMMAERPE